MALPTWNGVQLVSAGSSIIPSIQLAGPAIMNFSSSTYFGINVLIEPSVAYTTFSLQTSTANSLGKQTGASIATSGQNISINARIPIEGWQGSNIIVGSFSGLQNCTSTLACTDTFSVKVSSAGVVSEENVDWINGNCTVATGTYTCNFNTSIFTVAPTCVASSNNTPAVAASGISVIGQTVSAATVYTYDNVQGPRPFSLICQKQGADYVGKTALAVASDQNVRSIGSTGMDIQSVYFGSGATCDSACTTGNCTICNQVGSKITSVSFVSTGTYNINGIDGTKYNCISNSNQPNAGGLATAVHIRSSSTSTYARLTYYNGGTAVNSYQSVVTCLGIP